jgi:hypothetical protein
MSLNGMTRRATKKPTYSATKSLWPFFRGGRNRKTGRNSPQKLYTFEAVMDNVIALLVSEPMKNRTVAGIEKRNSSEPPDDPFVFRFGIESAETTTLSKYSEDKKQRVNIDVLSENEGFPNGLAASEGLRRTSAVPCGTSVRWTGMGLE